MWVKAYKQNRKEHNRTHFDISTRHAFQHRMDKQNGNIGAITYQRNYFINVMPYSILLRDSINYHWVIGRLKCRKNLVINNN